MTEKPIKPLSSRPRPLSTETDPAQPGTVRNPLIIKSATNPTLTFNDGLNFGCGFFVAGFLFSIAIIPISFFILSVLAVAGR